MSITCKGHLSNGRIVKKATQRHIGLYTRVAIAKRSHFNARQLFFKALYRLAEESLSAIGSAPTCTGRCSPPESCRRLQPCCRSDVHFEPIAFIPTPKRNKCRAALVFDTLIALFRWSLAQFSQATPSCRPNDSFVFIVLYYNAFLMCYVVYLGTLSQLTLVHSLVHHYPCRKRSHVVENA